MSTKEDSLEIKSRSKGYMIFIIIFMGLVGIMDTYLATIEGVAFYYVMEEFNLLPAELALWQAIYGTLAFSVFLLGWFSDTYGRKKGMLALLLVMGIPALLIGMLHYLFLSFHLFMILYGIIMTGTVSNMWEIPISEESPPKKRGMYGGIVTLLSIIPISMFFGVAIAENFGWQWTFGVMFFYMLGLLIFLFFMKEPQRWLDTKEKRTHKIFNLKTALKSFTRKDIKYLLLASLTYGIWGICFKLTMTWIMHYYVNVIGYSPDEFYRISIISGIFLLLGAISALILLDKIGRKRTCFIGSIGSVIGFIGLGITTLPIFIWMICYCMTLTYAFIMVYFAEIFRNEIRSTAVGVIATLQRISYVVGPLIAVILFLAFPTMEMFWIIAGLLMITPMFFLLAKPVETKGQTLENIQEIR